MEQRILELVGLQMGQLILVLVGLMIELLILELVGLQMGRPILELVGPLMVLLIWGLVEPLMEQLILVLVGLIASLKRQSLELVELRIQHQPLALQPAPHQLLGYPSHLAYVGACPLVVPEARTLASRLLAQLPQRLAPLLELLRQRPQ